MQCGLLIAIRYGRVSFPKDDCLPARTALQDRYQTEVESWRNLQSANIEFTMKRLREPIESAG